MAINGRSPDQAADRESITATLIVKRTPPRPGRRDAYTYDVEFDGELVVKNSVDAECDLARVLVARGLGGWVTIIDGATGEPRSRVNIAKAALLTVREDSRKGPLFVAWKPFLRVDGSSPKPESDARLSSDSPVLDRVASP